MKSEYDETEIIYPQDINDDIEDMLNYYGYGNQSDEMHEYGVSWSDFI